HVHDAELRAVGADDADWRDADLAVDPNPFCGVLDAVSPLEEKKCGPSESPHATTRVRRVSRQRNSSSTPRNLARAEGWDQRLPIRFANCAVNVDLMVA